MSSLGAYADPRCSCGEWYHYQKIYEEHGSHLERVCEGCHTIEQWFPDEGKWRTTE